MKKCPRCKKEFFYDIHFCPVCGYEDMKSQSTDFTICPQCKTEYSYKIDHCTRCGYSTDKYKEKIKNMQNDEMVIKDEHKPKCPTCQSTNIKKISTTSKVANTAIFGLLGTKRHRTFHCNNCGYEW